MVWMNWSSQWCAILFHWSNTLSTARGRTIYGSYLTGNNLIAVAIEVGGGGGGVPVPFPTLHSLHPLFTKGTFLYPS